MKSQLGPTDEQPFSGAVSDTQYTFEQPTWFDFGYYQVSRHPNHARPFEPQSKVNL